MTYLPKLSKVPPCFTVAAPTLIELIAAALAAGKTHRDAAAEAGVSEKTVFRRAADPALKARVGELRAGMVAAAAGELASGMSEASRVLRELLGNDDPHVRFRASVKVVELGLKTNEQVELERRISKLEADAADQGEHHE